MRVISLVPSLTLTLAELGLDKSQLVGRTPWCIHPESFVQDVPIVGGTKTPNLNKIRNAQPDLVIVGVFSFCLLHVLLPNRIVVSQHLSLVFADF